MDSDRPLPPYANRTCGQCMHWFKVQTELEIQKVPQGQCRRNPPCGQMINGQQTVCFYPPIHANFGACGEFESLLERLLSLELNNERDETA